MLRCCSTGTGNLSFGTVFLIAYQVRLAGGPANSMDQSASLCFPDTGVVSLHRHPGLFSYILNTGRHACMVSTFLTSVLPSLTAAMS